MENKKKWATHKTLKKQWMDNPSFRGEYEKLAAEYQIARQIISARLRQNLSQEDLAKRVGTGQAVISRLEGAVGLPSVSLLKRVAKALSTELHLTIH